MANVLRNTSEWPWTLSSQKYSVNTKCLSPKPTFCSCFSRASPFWNARMPRYVNASLRYIFTPRDPRFLPVSPENAPKFEYASNDSRITSNTLCPKYLYYLSRSPLSISLYAEPFVKYLCQRMASTACSPKTRIVPCYRKFKKKYVTVLNWIFPK